ncbi:MAG: hypothetical protein ACK4KT_07980 [Thermaurantimonas sp.]
MIFRQITACLFILFTGLFGGSVYGQKTEPISIPAPGFDYAARREYFSGLFSAGFTTFRDFATSPLFYSGPGLLLSTSAHEKSARHEQQLDLRFGFYTAFDGAPESSVLSGTSISTLGNVHVYYHYLFALPKISSEAWNFKVGPSLIITQNFRINPSLFNNSLGLENITNLMVSGTATYNISRKQARTLNLYLFKIHLPKRTRELRMQLNTGVLNFNFRPGYAYSYNSEIIGTETSPLTWVFANYRWSMNGWRLQTHMEWLWYLHNGNAFSLSYQWDALHAPGRYEAFQMASHNVGFSYYFERKIRRLE